MTHRQEVYLTDGLRKSLKAYRDRRRIERGGRMLTVSVAIAELLAKALEGVEPQAPVTLAGIVHRLERLERAVLPEPEPIERGSPQGDGA